MKTELISKLNLLNKKELTLLCNDFNIQIKNSDKKTQIITKMLNYSGAGIIDTISRRWRGEEHDPRCNNEYCDYDSCKMCGKNVFECLSQKHDGFALCKECDQRISRSPYRKQYNDILIEYGVHPEQRRKRQQQQQQQQQQQREITQLQLYQLQQQQRMTQLQEATQQQLLKKKEEERKEEEQQQIEQYQQWMKRQREEEQRLRWAEEEATQQRLRWAEEEEATQQRRQEEEEQYRRWGEEQRRLLRERQQRLREATQQQRQQQRLRWAKDEDGDGDVIMTAASP
jgi:hypothetical protein